MLYRVVMIGRTDPRRTVYRSGINYELDLREGIDLAIYLFGRFQRHVTDGSGYSLPVDGTAIDVGANSGTLTLRFAQQALHGVVHAFEPAHSAFRALTRNVELNPELGKRIVCHQAFVADVCADDSNLTAFSSWRVDGVDDARHPIHGGSSIPADGVPSITIDSFCVSRGIESVDLIKIDTEGYEWDVLVGAIGTITRFRPHVIFEVGGHVLEERGLCFDHFLAFFTELEYELVDSADRRSITYDNFTRRVPRRSTIDVMAIPSEHRRLVDLGEIPER